MSKHDILSRVFKTEYERAAPYIFSVMNINILWHMARYQAAANHHLFEGPRNVLLGGRVNALQVNVAEHEKGFQSRQTRMSRSHEFGRLAACEHRHSYRSRPVTDNDIFNVRKRYQCLT